MMTGNCKDGNTARYQSMESIATASSGQVYHINKTEVKNVGNNYFLKVIYDLI